MNLHEYQAKELLKKYNVPVQEGVAVETVEAAVAAYNKIATETKNKFAVVKAQIHAGGRGKGKIEGTEQRGVAVGKSAADIETFAKNILGGTLVTIQTGPAVRNDMNTMIDHLSLIKNDNLKSLYKLFSKSIFEVKENNNA
jgi:succinyl-CoA synthetase beta subunit